MRNDYQPFHAPVDGGELFGGQWRAQQSATVLAVHGITASHLTWPWLADRLPGQRVVAPDLRGRARSNALPGPYGLRRQAEDLARLLDFLEVERVVVVGHSMGAFVAVWLAHRYPDRVDSLVLVDGGLPIPRDAGIDPLLMLGPAAERLSQTFETEEAYLNFWRGHPAFRSDWSRGVADFARYDLDGAAPTLHPSARLGAVAENVMELDGSNGFAEALTGLTVPMSFLRAPRGLQNEPTALYDNATVADWAARLPSLTANEVDDVNHYTVVMSDRGADRVAATVREHTCHTAREHI
ncbi:alpha/beta fold hydrolase [Cryobacterium sp. PH31-O1]|uniref:alpha/beta fold hydrolase n=1 Tax=Cryobacterium sp. PH31-O1 TaxID=3046306 RepID=UPI0024B89ACC|nr:alpha/beta fold hydrolase [Cryobacterium sp. PH31-O1]MDJ0339444.1 alpha/beta fold hydrolase [Cryobacterium sp. PH31-O1]